MVISERCVSDPNQVEGQELDLTPGSPLVLTHRIRLVPSSGSGSCCQSEFAALLERIEALEREASELRQKCGGLDGSCCTSQQSKGKFDMLRVTLMFSACFYFNMQLANVTKIRQSINSSILKKQIADTGDLTTFNPYYLECLYEL